MINDAVLVNFGMLTLVNAVLFVIAKSPVILVRLLAWMKDREFAWIPRDPVTLARALIEMFETS